MSCFDVGFQGDGGVGAHSVKYSTITLQSSKMGTGMVTSKIPLINKYTEVRAKRREKKKEKK